MVRRIRRPAAIDRGNLRGPRSAGAARGGPGDAHPRRRGLVVSDGKWHALPCCSHRALFCKAVVFRKAVPRYRRCRCFPRASVDEPSHNGTNSHCMNETDALLALNMLPKVGPVRVRRLMEACGGAAAVLRTPA